MFSLIEKEPGGGGEVLVGGTKETAEISWGWGGKAQAPVRRWERLDKNFFFLLVLFSENIEHIQKPKVTQVGSQ